MRKRSHINIIMLVLMSGLFVYFFATFIKQQDEISLIKAEMRSLEQKIEKEKEIQEELLEQANQIDSDEFIERIAREKLGMVKEGERLYIDAD
ncbi:MAG: septum formation initiator family protein [Clostridiaceae bacterium]|jgi:cell division protein DivIC|nr:septum formation initiator family protein [Clostridiaceae bacterium]